MKERVTINNIKKLTKGLEVTFSNNLTVCISNDDLLTFEELNFTNWEIGEVFDIKKEGFKTTLNPVNTNIYYKL